MQSHSLFEQKIKKEKSSSSLFSICDLIVANATALPAQDVHRTNFGAVAQAPIISVKAVTFIVVAAVA